MADEKKSLEALKAEHTPDAIRRRLSDGPGHSYLRDFIYGAIDGAVTTFAVVAGVAGAGLSAGIVIILGIANLVADGFSMAASNYLATRAEHQQRERARQQERRHIERFPAGEREEIRQIFKNKGFEGDDLEHAVDIITSDVERWIDTMMQDELGLPLAGPSPIKAGSVTFIAFLVVGAVPLLTFTLNMISPGAIAAPFAVAMTLTCIAFFIVGACKSRFIDQRWWLAGLETLGIGGAAAAIAYLIGMFLKSLAG